MFIPKHQTQLAILNRKPQTNIKFLIINKLFIIYQEIWFQFNHLLIFKMSRY